MTNDDQRRALARAIRQLVKAKSISQKHIALETAVSESTVSRWMDEDSQALPDGVQLAAICRLAEVTPGELLGPLVREAGGDDNLVRLWGLVLGLTPAQRMRLADLIEVMAEG